MIAYHQYMGLRDRLAAANQAAKDTAAGELAKLAEKADELRVKSAQANDQLRDDLARVREDGADRMAEAKQVGRERIAKRVDERGFRPFGKRKG